MSATSHWLTDPKRLPAVVISLMLAFVVLASGTAILYVRQAGLSSRQTATEAAQTAVRSAVCEGLRQDIGEPDDPAPSTPLGKVKIQRAKARYASLDCAAAPLAGQAAPRP